MRTERELRQAVRALYRLVIDNRGEPGLVSVFADALEDVGADPWVIAAYRWAARLGRWPFLRCRRRDPARMTIPEYERLTGMQKRRRDLIYDWDSLRRGTATGRGLRPDIDKARLPHELFTAMLDREGPGKPYRHRYRGVHSAFMLLAYALQKCPELLKLEKLPTETDI